MLSFACSRVVANTAKVCDVLATIASDSGIGRTLKAEIARWKHRSHLVSILLLIFFVLAMAGTRTVFILAVAMVTVQALAR
jgi:hypothetical protein